MPRKKGAYSPGQLAEWRERIKVGKAIKTLNETVAGTLECSPVRLKAVEIILRKTIPDLSSVSMEGDNTPLRFTWGPATPEPVIIDHGPTRHAQQGCELFELDVETVLTGEARRPFDSAIVNGAHRRCAPPGCQQCVTCRCRPRRTAERLVLRRRSQAASV